MAVFVFTNSTGMVFGSVQTLVTQTVNVFLNGTITDVDLTLGNLTHTYPADLDVALFAPDPTRNLVVMSDAGGDINVVNATFTLDDSAAEAIPYSSSIGLLPTYRPANYFDGLGDETSAQFGQTAPLISAAPTGSNGLSTAFDGAGMVGSWTLAVSDDQSGDGGNLVSWQLRIETAFDFTQIQGTGGNDRLEFFPAGIAGTGQITFNGSTASFADLFGAGFFPGEGVDTLIGSNERDFVNCADALDGDQFDGGDGNEDTLRYEGVDFVAVGQTQVTWNLQTGTAIAGATSEVIQNFENLVTANANDSITGTGSDNSLTSWSGNDTIAGLGGNDFLDGGSGNDSLLGGEGNDLLDGMNGSDVLIGEAGDDIFRDIGLDGQDSFYGGSGNDALFFGLAEDGVQIDLLNQTIQTGHVFSSIEQITGSNLDDVFYAANGNETLQAENGDDTLHGRDGADSLFGGNGNDVLLGGAGADRLDGDAGERDRVQYTDSAAGLRVDLQVAATNTGIAAGDTFLGVEDIHGSFHGDTLLGDTGANIIVGESGSDAWLDGRVGNDTIYGGAGNDVLIGGWGADVLDGGSGTRDRVQYTDAATGLRVDIQVTTFNTGIAAGDTFLEVEDIYGSFQGDTLLGNGGANVIWGDAGNDAWLDGRTGNDTIYGGAGNDVLIGGWGADVLDGGSGTRDRVQYTDAATGLRVDIQVAATNTGVAAGDTFTGIEDIYGSFHGDTLVGDGGGNLIWGSAGNDLIDGRLGNDTLIGGAGNDTLTGGSGADVFVFETALGATNRDTIISYTVADDMIHLDNAVMAALGAAGALAATAFTTGAAATTPAHRILYNSANGQLLYDADGNGAGAAVLFATLAPGLAMAAGEFLVV